MSVRFPRCRKSSRAAVVLAVLVLATGVSGCAQIGETVPSAFADPATYELYDCKQLEASRKGLEASAKDQEALMAKAKTGVGGTVVGEMVYRNELISIHSKQRLVEEAWRKGKCHEAPPDSATPAPAPTPAPDAKGAKPPRPLIH